MDNKQQGEVSFLGLLFLVFLTLKLTGYITWSWWWVTAPLWGLPAFVLTVVGVVFAFIGVGKFIKLVIRKVKNDR